MDEKLEKIIKLHKPFDNRQEVQEICDYASDSFDKIIVLGMKKIENVEEYRMMGNYKDERDVIWNLEAAKTAILTQNRS